MVLILPAQSVSFMYLKPISKFGQSISISILSSPHDQDATFGSIFCGNAAAILLCLTATQKGEMILSSSSRLNEEARNDYSGQSERV
jgi:hypothetical protein